MNKNQFLNALRKHLSMLSVDERNEIISFYEDRFNNATYEGKSESEVINDLESPYEIAQNVLNEYGIEMHPKKKVEPASVIGLIFFDLFISSWLVPVLIFVPFSMAVSWFSYFFTLDVFFEYNFIKALAAFLISTALHIIYLIAILYITAVALKLLTMIVNWHISVFTGKDKSFNLSIFKKLNKFNINHNKLVSVAAISLILTLSLSIIWRSTSVSAKDSMVDTINVTEYDVFDDYDLEADFVNMNVEITPTTSDKIIITHYNKLDVELSYTETNDGLKIQDHSTSNWNNHTLTDLFRYLDGNSILNNNANITIEVPKDVFFSDFSVYVENGSIEVSSLNSESTELDSVNGEVIINDFTVEDLEVSTVNGKVSIENGLVSELDASTTNGSINLYNINNPTNDGNRLNSSTVNGSIQLDDVYIKDVNLSTVNGSIEYYNSDTTYKLEDFNFSSVIGKVESNISK